ncbi:MAG: mitofilin family membrane protein [Methyloceanibacter sp.]|uniref:COG4223 family protein n=1 Tax=Methyloceanibacter sp. TaxID=1965321 RepID=UPI003D6CF86A
MAGSFDKKGSGPGKAGKRPAPTIEGTATEVPHKAPADEAASTKDEAPTEKEPPALSAAAGKAGEPEPEAAKEPPRTSRTGSVLSHLAAGIAGGLVAAAILAVAWVWLPLSETPQGPDVAALEDRIAKLEAVPLPQGDDEALAKLEARLAGLEDKTPETPAEVAALADRVGQLEASLKSLAEAAKDGGSVAEAAAIDQQIGEAERRLDEKIDTALGEAKSANAAALETLKKEIAAVDAKLKALAEAEFGSADASRLLPEIAVLDERLAKLESTIPALLDAVDQDAEETRTATLAIAFANLRAAVSEGRPYAAELSTLAALSPGAGDLGALLDYDDVGIPTVPELARSFKVAKDASLVSSAPDPGGSILDRLLASAESLVKVRRVDAEAEGDAPDAVLARAEAFLEEGDLAATVKEVETLRDAQAASFATWLDQARARLAAEETLQRLENILLVSLSETDASPGAAETDGQE